jgi:hypothetical protein
MPSEKRPSAIMFLRAAIAYYNALRRGESDGFRELYGWARWPRSADREGRSQGPVVVLRLSLAAAIAGEGSKMKNNQ